MVQILALLVSIATAATAQPAVVPELLSSDSQIVDDYQRTGIPILPYLRPGDFDGFPDGRMHVANVTYRIYGEGLLPIMPGFMDTIRVLYEGIYDIADLEIAVDAQPSPSAPITYVATNLAAYEAASPSPATAALAANDSSPSFDAYQSVDLMLHVSWNSNTTLPRLGGGIEATYNQFHEQSLVRQGIQAKEFTMSYVMTREASPILSRIPLVNLGSYTVVIQLAGAHVSPFDVRKQTLLTSVLYRLMVNTASAACFRVAAVSEAVFPDPANSSTRNSSSITGSNGYSSSSSNTSSSDSADDGSMQRPLGMANVTLVISNKDLQLSTTSLQAAMTLIFGRNLLFITAMATAGLEVDAKLLSVDPLPGDSITDTIQNYVAEYTRAISAVALETARRAVPTGAIAGIATAVGVAGIGAAMGLFVWRRQRQGRRPGDHSKSSHFGEGAYGSRNCPFDGLATSGGGPDPKAVPLGSPPLASLSEFQKLALQFGIEGIPAGPDERAAKDGDSGSSSQASREKLKSGDSANNSSDDSGMRLTKHRARKFVHGWDIGTGDIEICRRPDGSNWVLGEGSFGMVFRAVRSGVQDVAVKVLTRVDDNQLQQFSKEISILKSLSFDRNIVQFYGACLQDGNPMLVLEYMEGGDLSQAMGSERGAELCWYRKGRLIALDIARGLHFLHSNKVMHSDLKTKNILLTKDYSCAKIGDVGLARIMSSAYFTNAQLGGTFSYAAPELLLNARCSEKVDIYSSGVVLWELVTGEQPHRGHLREVQVPEECPESISQLINDCLEVDQEKRPTAKQLFYRIRDAFVDGPNELVAVSSLGTDASIPTTDATAEPEAQEGPLPPVRSPSDSASSTQPCLRQRRVSSGRAAPSIALSVSQSSLHTYSSGHASSQAVVSPQPGLSTHPGSASASGAAAGILGSAGATAESTSHLGSASAGAAAAASAGDLAANAGPATPRQGQSSNPFSIGSDAGDAACERALPPTGAPNAAGRGATGANAPAHVSLVAAGSGAAHERRQPFREVASPADRGATGANAPAHASLNSAGSGAARERRQPFREVASLAGRGATGANVPAHGNLIAGGSGAARDRRQPCREAAIPAGRGGTGATPPVHVSLVTIGGQLERAASLPSSPFKGVQALPGSHRSSSWAAPAVDILQTGSGSSGGAAAPPCPFALVQNMPSMAGSSMQAGPRGGCTAALPPSPFSLGQSMHSMAGGVQDVPPATKAASRRHQADRHWWQRPRGSKKKKKGPLKISAQ